jgi:anti-repressor protein
MEQLIKIEKSEGGKQVCSARETYIALGLDASQWARWYKTNITNNPYAIENEDWALLDMMSKTSDGGRPTQDFAITIDFAKRIAMMAKTEKRGRG